MPKLSEVPLVHETARVESSTLGRYTEIGAGCRVEASELGDYSYLTEDFRLFCATVGKFANIAASTRLNATNHPMHRATLHHFTYRAGDYFDDAADEADFFADRKARRVTVGHDTWIGHGVTVLPGVSIGNGAVVGSGAVVSRDVAPYTIVGGVPARPIRQRFSPRPSARAWIASPGGTGRTNACAKRWTIFAASTRKASSRGMAGDVQTSFAPARPFAYGEPTTLPAAKVPPLLTASPSVRPTAPRAAVYFTPPAGAALTRAAADWLGRDAFSGEPTRDADPALDPLVAEPARYGFHATIRAPFRLAEGLDLEDADARLAAFCASRRPVTVPAMELAALGPFFALVPAQPSLDLADLEAATLDAFEPLRAPLTPAEIARRRPDRLSDRQREHLDTYGYPHVLEDFRFHMTLTGPVPQGEAQAVRARLATRFGAFVGAPLEIASLALFIEAEPGAPFRVHSLHHFGAAAAPLGGDVP